MLSTLEPTIGAPVVAWNKLDITHHGLFGQVGLWLSPRPPHHLHLVVVTCSRSVGP